MIKMIIVGLLTSVAAIMGTEVLAHPCTPTSGGGCVHVTKGMSCEKLHAHALGNVEKDPKSVGCEVRPPAGSSTLPLIVFCSNFGGNVAPGVNAILNDSFGGFAQIFPTQVNKNGFAKGLKVTARLTPAQLDELEPICDEALNPNWFPVDAVATEADVVHTVIDETTGAILNEESLYCQLPNPSTLAWDNKAEQPERRQYNCVQN